MFTSKIFRKTSNKILQEPDNRLRIVSEYVKRFDGQVKKISGELFDVLKEVDQPINLWLGMAAPQIGYDKRIVALKKAYKNYTLMINPEILEKKWFLPSIERCFSLRDKGWYLLKRYFFLKIKYQDLLGKYHYETLVGHRACAMQQEIDHLNGKLICDYG